MLGRIEAARGQKVQDMPASSPTAQVGTPPPPLPLSLSPPLSLGYTWSRHAHLHGLPRKESLQA